MAAGWTAACLWHLTLKGHPQSNSVFKAPCSRLSCPRMLLQTVPVGETVPGVRSPLLPSSGLGPHALYIFEKGYMIENQRSQGEKSQATPWQLGSSKDLMNINKQDYRRKREILYNFPRKQISALLNRDNRSNLVFRNSCEYMLSSCEENSPSAQETHENS